MRGTTVKITCSVSLFTGIGHWSSDENDDFDSENDDNINFSAQDDFYHDLYCRQIRLELLPASISFQKIFFCLE